MILFTQLVQGSVHVTLNFNKEDSVFPGTISENDMVEIFKVGEFSDFDIDCDIVTVEGSTHQPSGTLLHITRATRNGVKPVQSGLRATEHGYAECEPESLGMFKATYFKTGG